MKKKIRTLTAAFLCMCMLVITGCGSSDDSGVGGIGGRNSGGGDTTGGSVTTQATTGDVITTQATTGDVITTQVTTGEVITTQTTQQVTTQATQQVTTEATTQQTPGVLETVTIENDYYSVTLPKTWTWEEWGVGAGFCFRCTNPDDPSMVIMYAGTLSPIFTSDQQKQPYYNLGEYGQIYIDAPVFADQTVSSIFNWWEYIVQYQIKYQGYSLFPAMTNVVDQGSQIKNDRYHNMNANFTDSIGSAYATSANGTSVVCICQASIGGDPMDLFAIGYDNNIRVIYDMYFVECPQDKSEYVQQMMECALSLQFTEKAAQGN